MKGFKLGISLSFVRIIKKFSVNGVGVDSKVGVVVEGEYRWGKGGF